MRKFILIAATLLVSVSAHAEGDRGLIKIASTDTVQQAEPAPAPQAAATEATATEAAPAPVRPAAKPKVRRETDEHKARRIAARYGVYW